MKVKDYLEGLDNISNRFKPSNENVPSLKDTMISEVSIWSNEASKGYSLKAMENAGLNDEQIKAVLLEMSYCFNDITVEEAERIYNNY